MRGGLQQKDPAESKPTSSILAACSDGVTVTSDCHWPRLRFHFGPEPSWWRMEEEMDLHAKPLALVALALMSADCKSVGPQTRESAPCAVGSYCSLVGRLTVYRGAPASIGELDIGGQCVAVAMTQADFERLEHVRG